MPELNHARDRSDRITENLRAVVAKAQAGERLTDGYGMPITELHNLSADLDTLTLFAERWEAHCRANTLNPRTGNDLLSGLGPGEALTGPTADRVLRERVTFYYADRQHAFEPDWLYPTRCKPCGEFRDALLLSVPIHA